MDNITCLCGQNAKGTIIELVNVEEDTTLITMGENCLIENLTFNLTSTEHHILKGVVFGAASAVSSKLRNCYLTITNSSAPFTGTGETSEVYGVEANGSTGTGPDLFAYNCIEGCTITILSNGNGNKRGILVSGDNVMSIRDTNIFVAAPPEVTSEGSYVGVETNDTSEEGTGSIQIRNSAIGVGLPDPDTNPAGAFTASDILQTTPATFTTPNYREGPGILIGPGTELVTKTAGDKGFSVYNYTSSVFYGVIGAIDTGPNTGSILPGAMFFSATYPLDDIIYTTYKVQQPTLIMGVSCELYIGPSEGFTVTITLEAFGNNGTSNIGNPLILIINDDESEKTLYNESIHLDAGDLFTVSVAYTSEEGSTNGSQHLKVYVHLF
jgi:hypothetical protein